MGTDKESQVGESFTREAEMVAGFCPLLLSSSPPAPLHPFHFICESFVLMFVGWREGTKTDTAAGVSKRHSDHRINYPTCVKSENIGIRKEQGGAA